MNTLKRRYAARRAAGFTMIEVLVALTIIAIGLTAALRAAGSLAVDGGALHQRLLAGFSADNALAQLRLKRTWPPLGTTHFACAQGDIDFVCIRTVAVTPNPNFRRIEIVVKHPARDEALARLITVIPNEKQRPL